MRKKYTKRDIREAAAAVQQVWLYSLAEQMNTENTPLPENLAMRLSQALETQQESAAQASGKKRLFSHPRYRIITALLAICLLLGGWLAVDVKARAAVADGLSRLFSSKQQREYDAYKAYERLMDFIGGEGENRKNYRKAAGEAYRSVYGGAYLNTDKTLVIFLTEDTEEIRQVFRNALQFDEVLFKAADYSSDELYALYERINVRVQEEAFPDTDAEWELDVTENRVQVHLSELTEETRDAFFRWLGTDAERMIIFSEKNGYSITTPESLERAKLDQILKNELFDDCHLIKLGNIDAARTPAAEPSREQIERFMQRRVENAPMILRSEKSLVEEGDLLKASWRIYSETKIYEDLMMKEETIRCGETTPSPYRQVIERSVEGRKVGETFTIEMNREAFGADEPLWCDVTIRYIYTVTPAVLDDAFVRTNTEYDSVEAWREALFREELRDYQSAAWEEVLEKLLPASSFRLNEGKIREKTENPDDTIAQIKEYLLVRALADACGIEVTAEDTCDYCSRNRINPEAQTVRQAAVTEWRVLRELVIEEMTK
ncbi:MAG: hypothetical protein J5496_03660 [Lachnospiraceae bacterium]|nr:hypothetical protein [Lachnospiraceae bacterium]